MADKLYRNGKSIGLRVLVIEAGSFLLPTHVQNMPRLGLNSPAERVVATDAQDPGPQNLVWGHPWHSNQAFPGLAYCFGGRSLFWGGWSPRLTTADLSNWPTDIATFLQAAPGSFDGYQQVEKEIGVWDKTDYISGPLFDELKNKMLGVQALV